MRILSVIFFSNFLFFILMTHKTSLKNNLLKKKKRKIAKARIMKLERNKNNGNEKQIETVQIRKKKNFRCRRFFSICYAMMMDMYLCVSKLILIMVLFHCIMCVFAMRFN